MVEKPICCKMQKSSSICGIENAWAEQPTRLSNDNYCSWSVEADEWMGVCPMMLLLGECPMMQHVEVCKQKLSNFCCHGTWFFIVHMDNWYVDLDDWSIYNCLIVATSVLWHSALWNLYPLVEYKLDDINSHCILICLIWLIVVTVISWYSRT